MMAATTSQPVVVGIDGSQAALDAALWAVDEAVARDVPLRLVYVADAPQSSAAPYAANDIKFEYGETSLRAASSAIEATGKAVKVEAEIVWGPIDQVLTAESKSASMLYIGSVGIGWIARRVLGSVATTVSEHAHCPVVVVRSPLQTRQLTYWVVVGVDDRPDNDRLVTHALDEAQLRHAPVLAVATWSSVLSGVSYDGLENRVASWRRRHPDLHILPVATGGGLPGFLAGYRDAALLAVLSAADADQIPQIVGPHERSLVPHAGCSVVVVH